MHVLRMCYLTVLKLVFVGAYLSIDLCSSDVLLDCAKICIFLSVAVHLSINVCAINVVANKFFLMQSIGSSEHKCMC